MSRLLALLVAGALVVGAFVVRDRLDGAGRAGNAAEAATLVCIPELRTVCEELAARAAEEGTELSVQVAPAWSTVDELQAGEGRPGHLWLTFDPFPRVLADRRARAGVGPLPLRSESLARSPLVLAVWDDRGAVLEQHCGGETSWRCIGDVAGQPWAGIGGEEGWGLVKPGYADPSGEAEGTLVLAQAAASRLGGPPSRSDLQEPGFFSWFAGLQEAVPDHESDSPLVAMAQFGRARFDVVGTTEAAAVDLLERAGSRVVGLTLHPSPPTMTAEVVLTRLGEAPATAVAAVRDVAPAVLSAHGWRVDAAAPDGGLAGVRLPEGSGPPDAGVVEAVRSEVRT